MFETVCGMFVRFLDKNLWDVCRMFEWSMEIFIECLKEIYGMFAECLKEVSKMFVRLSSFYLLDFPSKGIHKIFALYDWHWLMTLTLIEINDVDCLKVQWLRDKN